MREAPANSTIAVLVRGEPPWAQDPSSGVVWCATASELAVLARRGQLRAAVIDALLATLDTELIGLVRRSCPVLVVDDLGSASRWEAIGASALPALPPDPASLLAAVQVAESAARRWVPRCEPPRRRAALLTVLAAPGGDGTATATSVALALASACARPGAVVLADLTLDAPHRALHGITPDRTGLPELIEAARFGPPPTGSTAQALHPTGRGYLVVPGLLRHHDWVTVGERAAASGLDAIRDGTKLVVAHVDRDLEGESDTGSFDIEDRNVLARTAVGAADLVVVAAGAHRSGRLGLIVALGALARFDVPQRRTVVVRTAERWPHRRSRPRVPRSARVLEVRAGDRPDNRLGTALLARLAAGGSPDQPGSSEGRGPQRIAPGTLGHWAHDSDGWITPRVPQHP